MTHQRLGQASIHDDVLPADIAGAGAGEENGDIGNIKRPSNRSQRHDGFATLRDPRCLIKTLAERGSNEPWAYGIAADPAWTPSNASWRESIATPALLAL